MSRRVRGALVLLEAMTRRPLALDESVVADVRREGLGDADITAVGAVGFHFNLMNRFADAFDFEVPTGGQKSRMARLLNLHPPEGGPSVTLLPVRGASGRVLPAELSSGRAQVVSAPGITSPALRRQVEAFVYQSWEVPGFADATLPASMEAYVQKLSRYAYRIVDEDVERMRADGYVDEAIYELTLVGAMTAASVGLEQLFGVLHAD